jgi:hypothetical protein
MSIRTRPVNTAQTRKPRPVAAEIGQAGGDRPGHPDVEIGMGGQERSSGSQPVPQASIPGAGLAEHRVVIEEAMIAVGAASGNRRGHRPITARAAAYSVATCSIDEFT